MKNILLFVPALLLVSCEEVVELDLDTAANKIVVEAGLDAGNAAFYADLSYSAGFYDAGIPDKIEGAAVSLVRENGENIAAADLGNGKYRSENIALAEGDRISLIITLPDGNTLKSAPAAVPPSVPLDALIIEKNESGGPGGGNTAESYTLSARWKDVPGQENFYRLKIYRNGALQSGLYILTDDRLGDGAVILRPVLRQAYSRGDTLRCQLMSVDKAYFDYFQDLANSEGRGFSMPAPYNPKGNLGEDILGCFGVWQISEKTLVVQ